MEKPNSFLKKNRLVWATVALAALAGGGYWFIKKSSHAEAPSSKPMEIPSSETASLNPEKTGLPEPTPTI